MPLKYNKKEYKSGYLNYIPDGTRIVLDVPLNDRLQGILIEDWFADIDVLSKTEADALYEPIIIGGATTIAQTDLTASKALISNASGKVAVSTVTSTELGYLSGVTSAIQTQLNTKALITNGSLILPTYADNATALTGGLVATNLYKTVTGEVRIVV